MRNRFLGTGEPGYHPLRKLRTVFSGLRSMTVGTLDGAIPKQVGVDAIAGCFRLVLGRL